jgi:hypothetical protein
MENIPPRSGECVLVEWKSQAMVPKADQQNMNADELKKRIKEDADAQLAQRLANVDRLVELQAEYSALAQVVGCTVPPLTLIEPSAGAPPPPPPETKTEKRDRTSRRGQPLGPISDVLDFTYANKKEAFAFILCGAAFDDKTKPDYNFPTQTYTNLEQHVHRVPSGSFILPRFLVDEAKEARKRKNSHDDEPTVLTPDLAKKLPPPHILLREFCVDMELPYTWVIFLLTLQTRLPKCLRLADQRTAHTWQMTPLGWKAFISRDLHHIQMLAAHFRMIVRTECDPNCWTDTELGKPLKERPKIGKERAVAMAKRVTLDNNAIQKAYDDLAIPADQREPLGAQRGGAKLIQAQTQARA